jgi:putative transposase
MARLARIVIPGLPHHVTQRGNRREAIFFEDGDHEIYLDLLAQQTLKGGWPRSQNISHIHQARGAPGPSRLGTAVGSGFAISEPRHFTPSPSVAIVACVFFFFVHRDGTC